VASLYAGGGAGVNSSGCSFIRGGKVGIGLACAGCGGGACVRGLFIDVAGEATRGGGGGAIAPLLFCLLVGGFGRLFVLKPEVSCLYGTGGAGGFSASSRCSCRHFGSGTGPPSPPGGGGRGLVVKGELALVEVTGDTGTTADAPLCLGGGPKLSGSLSAVKGALW